jgi:hypothetical protein
MQTEQVGPCGDVSDFYSGGEGFPGFTQFLQENSGIVPQNRP